MGGLSRWAVHKPWRALAAWLVLVVGIAVLGTAFKGSLNDSFSLPETDSLRAQELLEQMPSGQSGGATTTTATIVWKLDDGMASDTAAAALITPLLTKVSALPAVACVTNPLDDTGASLGSGCPTPEPPPPADPNAEPPTPEQQEALDAALAATAKALSPISPDGRVAKSVVTFRGAADGSDVPVETASDIITLVKAANAEDGIQVGASGQILSFAGQEPPSSEGIGILVALVILLIAFGSVMAALLPLVTAVFGVSLGATLLLFVARFVDVATFAPTLAAMIGLGVGIDYSLFVINRFRQGIAGGRTAKDAALVAVNTSGRAVVFAASTVVIALLGLFVMRINFFNGLALAASGTVLLVMLSAVWLLPALLSLLGERAVTPGSLLIARGLERLRLGALARPFRALYARTRHARGTIEQDPEHGRWAAYGRSLQRRPLIPAVLSVGLVLLMAAPALSLRLGFPDDSGTPEGSFTRIAYDLTSEGFGAGANGPFFVAVQLPQAGDVEALGTIIDTLAATEGVAGTVPSAEMLPVVGASIEGQTITAIQVTPETGPQDEATSVLLERLRATTVPQILAETGATAYIGGTTAIVEDFSIVMRDAMPVFLSVVVGLGFLMLLVLFRSAVVSLTAVVTSLMSFAASTGITVAVFQWGWLNGPLGVTGTGPIFPFLPVMVFAILFGLSMDYHVFLVSRMQEEWSRTQDNAIAVRRGLGGSGRVVLMAALIMFSVFAAFIPTPNNTIKLFGIALSSAVLVDAFLIRLVFVPAFMSVLGAANWWLPGWLRARLPHFEVEGADDDALAREVETIVDDAGEPDLVSR